LFRRSKQAFSNREWIRLRKAYGATGSEGKKDQPQMNADRDGNLNSREKAQKTQKKRRRKNLTQRRKGAKGRRKTGIAAKRHKKHKKGPRMDANRRE
jgi:hypothetical protein